MIYEYVCKAKIAGRFYKFAMASSSSSKIIVLYCDWKLE